MIIRLVAAIGKNRELGQGNKLLWDLPDDLKHFREVTTGKMVLMGRKTYESIGRLLPKRTNVILTRNKDFQVPGAIVVPDLKTAQKIAKKENVSELSIIGGGEIYKLTLPEATHLSLTFVDAEFSEADTFFPKWDQKEWKKVSEEFHAKDERHEYSFRFVEFERI